MTTDDRGITYRDGQTGQTRKSVPLGKPVLAWSAKKGLLVCGIFDLTVVDAASGKVLHTIEDRTGSSVALSADGRTLVQGGTGGPTRFDVASGRKLDSREQSDDDTLRSTFTTLVLSADGRLVAGGDVGGSLRLFSMDEGWRQLNFDRAGGLARRQSRRTDAWLPRVPRWYHMRLGGG